MKQLLTSLGILIVFAVNSQDKREFIFNSSQSESISIDVSFPNIVLKTWDKDEVKITARININDGLNDDLFEMKSENRGSELVITSEIKDLDHLRKKSKRNTINYAEGDDSKISDNGNEIDIELEIYVPAKKALSIDAEFGMVEILELPNKVAVFAKFGGADLNIIESKLGSLEASSSWGQIYSNLTSDIDFSGDDMLGKRMTASIEKGSGKSLSVKSDFGNVYLRKN